MKKFEIKKDGEGRYQFEVQSTVYRHKGYGWSRSGDLAPVTQSDCNVTEDGRRPGGHKLIGSSNVYGGEKFSPFYDAKGAIHPLFKDVVSAVKALPDAKWVSVLGLVPHVEE